MKYFQEQIKQLRSRIGNIKKCIRFVNIISTEYIFFWMVKKSLTLNLT